MTSFDDNPLVMLGAGGHARVLLSLMQEAPAGCIDPQQPPAEWPDSTPWLGKDLDQLPGKARVIISLGSTKAAHLRRRVYNDAVARGLEVCGLIADTAIIARDVQMPTCAQILAGAIVQTGCMLGQNILVNTGALVEHDCILRDHVHVAVGAVLCGDVHVGEGAHIGAAATILQGVSIGENATVGAGAVVTKDVAANTVVVGSPARPIKK